MASKVNLKFYLNPQRGTPGSRSLYAYININGSKLRRSTSIVLNEKDFSEDKQRAKDHNINSKLNEYQTKFYDVAAQYNRNNKPLTPEIMWNYLFDNKALDIKLLEYADEFIAHAKTTGRIKHSTWKSMNTFRKKLETFVIKEYKSDIPISTLDISFVKKYDAFLNESNLHRNTIISNHHKHLKTVLNDAIKEKHIISSPYKGYTLKTIEGERDFLEYDELLRLENKLLSPVLDKCRDMFVFACYTSVRFSDLIKLTMQNVSMDGNQLSFRDEKTTSIQSVPIPKKAKDIIQKYADCDARKVEGRIFPKISNEKQNYYLKVVAEACEINKNLTTHVARHTYATRLLNKGVSLDVIQRALGHKSPKTTSIYAKMQAKTITESILNVLDNE